MKNLLKTTMLLFIGTGIFFILNGCSKEKLETITPDQEETSFDLESLRCCEDLAVTQPDFPQDSPTDKEIDKYRASSRVVFAQLSGAQVVPSVQSSASGRAQFQFVSVNTGGRDVEGLAYRIQVVGVAEIHSIELALAPAGDNGPTVAILYPDAKNGEDLEPDQASNDNRGTVVEGMLTFKTLTGLFAGNFKGFKRAIRNGEIYVIVNSANKPSGEIRGQL